MINYPVYIIHYSQYIRLLACSPIYSIIFAISVAKKTLRSP